MTREMKESGIEWMPQIPCEWEIIPNKYIMSKKKEICSHWNGEDVLSLTMNGVIVRDLENPSGKMPATFDGYQYVKPGDLLMCLFDIDVTPRCVGRVFNNGVTSPAYSNFKLNINADQSYYYYYYLMLDNSKELLHLAKNLRHSFTEEQLGIIKTPLPPLSEQQRIASFLDSKCQEIDNVLAKTRSSIEEYKKLKQAIITKAVTKGIRSNRKMKNSGIEWLGEIPEEWNIIKIKWLLDERKERSLEGKEEPLSMSQRYGIVPTKEMESIPNMASSFVGAKLAYKGDLVFNKLKAHLGVFSVSSYDGLVSPDYAVYCANDKADAKFLEYLFKTPQYIGEFKKKSTGIGAGLTRLYTDGLYSIHCGLPCLEEQKDIKSYIDSKCSEIDILISKKEQLINELEAYKKSLIYEYVTGKKEVNS